MSTQPLALLLLSGCILDPQTHAGQRWSGEFTTSARHPVSANAVVAHQSKLFVGGGFHWFNDVESPVVARSSMDGVWNFGGIANNGLVHDFFTVGEDLYAAGSITIGGQTGSIARWDGTRWELVGSLTFTAETVLVHDGMVYAGGGFFSDGGQFFQGVVKWDGTDWSEVGGGISGSVLSLAIYEDKLIAAGIFSQAGGMPAQRLASWDGVKWSEFAGGGSGGFTLLADGNDLYLGGFFDSVGGISANHIARWNGSAWSSLGSGISGPGGVVSLVKIGNDLYAAGNFTSAGGLAAGHVARWDGAQWHNLAGGLNGPVRELTAQGDRLVAVGDFSASGTTDLPGIAVWNGVEWSSLSTVRAEASVTLAALGKADDSVFGAGYFSDGQTIRAGFLGRWDGDGWERFDQPGNYFSFAASCEHDGDLYFATGRITEGGGNEIVRWNGTGFDRITNNLGSVIRVMESGPDGIFCGGTFLGIPAFSTPRLALLNGTNTSPVGGGIPNGRVIALEADGTDLYVGGEFVLPDLGSPNIAKWNGSEWSGLGEGLNGSVNDLLMMNGRLYAAGDFTQSGSVEAGRIAWWDGMEWHPLPGGFDNSVLALAHHRSDLFAAGRFTRIGNVEANHAAWWDGSKWRSLDEGLDATAWTALVAEGRLFLGGEFFSAGNETAYQLASWLVPQRLQIQSISGTGIELRWPNDAEGYLLQSSESLNPEDWKALTAEPEVNGNDLKLVLPIESPAENFRLIKP